MTLPSVGPTNLSRWLERLMLGTGSLLLGTAVLGWTEAIVYQVFLDWRLERAFREGAGPPAPSPVLVRSDRGVSGHASDRSAAPAYPAVRRVRAVSTPASESAAPLVGEPVGRLLAPRLRLSVVIAEGIAPRTLRRAVGHIPGTALPGQDGNVGLAAHRDTFFRRLKDLQVGDRLVVETAQGRFEYLVSETQVVGPERGDLLDGTDTPTLTLVTCYPFWFVGPAPQRFVVKAELVDATAS